MDYGMETWNCMCVSGLVKNQRKMKKKAKQPDKMDLKQTAEGGRWGGGLKLFLFVNVKNKEPTFSLFCPSFKFNFAANVGRNLANCLEFV
jgi:hypothetical protein